MKTSLFILVATLGLSERAWAYNPPCDHDGQHWAECPTEYPDHIGPVLKNSDNPVTKSVVEESQKINSQMNKNAADAKGTTPPTTEANNGNTNGGKKGAGCHDRTFGGADCETTEMINLGVGVANKLYQGVGSAAVQNKGTDVMNTLNAKGINVSNQDYLNGQADVAEKASKTNRNAGVAQTLNAGLQAWRAMEHNKSAKSGMENNYINRRREICADNDTNCYAEKKDQLQRLEDSYETEKMMQKKMAIQTGVAAALTAEQAGASFMQANMAKKTAEELRKRAQEGGGTQGNPYYYNNQMQQGQNEGQITGTPQVDTGAVVSNDPNEGALDGGFKDFNPNVGQNGALGPMAGEFKEGEAKGGGGGQGNGLGGSGGTSASRGEDGGKQEVAAGKPQTGGQYASGEGGGPKFSRGSGNTPVGVDSSFADLLKKMLPGNDEEKKEQASLEMPQDRGPASDQAAVIGRNKNIFIEISKRYQKKHTEGAVTFQ